MAPDFPYLFGNTRRLRFSHSFPGVVLLIFPGSLASLWLFHIALKRPVVRLLPSGFQVRLRQHLGLFPFGGATRFSAIALSVTIGLATHIGWDAFTHPFTWPRRGWAWLRSWIHVPLVGETEMYVVLQYISTAVGMVAIVLWIALWYRKTAPIGEIKPLQQKRFHAMLGAGMLAGGWLADLSELCS